MKLRNPDVTMVCVNLGMTYAFELMWESYLAHHDRDSVNLYVLNQLGAWRDDATEYSERVADKSFRLDRLVTHGQGLDYLIAQVTTPFTLVVDNDIEFLAPVLPDMMDALGVVDFGACAPCGDLGTCDMYGVQTTGQPRIEPWCALVDADACRNLNRVVSWASYGSRDLGKHWDVGGLLCHAAEAMEGPVKRLEWLPERVRHYGCISWGCNAPPDSPIRAVAEARYDTIKERLARLRGERTAPND